MIEIIKKLNIEVSKPNVFQAVVAKQYDMNTRFIEATLVDGGEKVSINHTPTVTVVINALRADGESRSFDGVVNDDGTVTVPLHSWMLELEGTVICDISVMDIKADDNKKLTTTSFTLLVEKAANGGEGITSDPQYDLLVKLLDRCDKADEMAEEALKNSEEANSRYNDCIEATSQALQAAAGVTTIEQNNNKKLQFWVGTQAEYDAIISKDETMFYLISDDPTEKNINSRFATNEQNHTNLVGRVEELERKTADPDVVNLTKQITNVHQNASGCARLVKSGYVVNFSFLKESYFDIYESLQKFQTMLCKLPAEVAPKQRLLVPIYTSLHTVDGPITTHETYITINTDGEVYLTVNAGAWREMTYLLKLGFNVTYILGV